MASARDWYRKSGVEVVREHESDLERGLAPDEASRRAGRYGRNVLPDARRKSAIAIFLGQFKDFFVLVLVGAALIAGFLGELEEIAAIGAILFLNAVLGFAQEYRAERAMEALRALAAPRARVRRGGGVAEIPALELVPGDVVLLEAGDQVPADVRLLEAAGVRIDESMLTGESEAVDKLHEALQERVPIADQRNMAFKGTLVTAGRAVGLVVGTGSDTELGRIAQLLREEVEVRTPLQSRIARFAKWIAIAVAVICAAVFGIGVARGEPPLEMLLVALSLAVAAVPEALPAVVTMALALGARRMSERKALVRKLPAVEALGSVTVVCADKTGTLTENRMQAAELRPAPGRGDELLRILTLSNDARVADDGSVHGDPTEVALLQAAIETGWNRREEERRHPRVAEIPFSAERGMMTTLHRAEGARLVLTKGAPERVLPLCRGAAEASRREADEMASRGLRVLAFARRTIPEKAPVDLEALEEELELVGLVGLMDPPRAEAAEAIALCRSAGIRVSMITGDHPSTARAIARRLAIPQPGREGLLTGRELESLGDDELRRLVEATAVYARVAPEQKIRIVRALQAEGGVVAMTGDGVNDAPALRRADIGVSMGKGGTDVAREASHLILLDDNFATIVAAMREGRRIYDNLRKFVRFALSGNSGEIWTLLLAPFLGLPVPLLPIHILWVNLVTDGLPGLALAHEPEERDLTRRPPRRPDESILARGLWQHAIWVGVLTAAVTLLAAYRGYAAGSDAWRSMAFTVLTITQMGHVLAIRSETDSFLARGVFTNWRLLAAVVLTFGLQMATLYLPALNDVLKTRPLSRDELLFCLAISTTVFFAVELEKWLRRRRENV
jgi:Ca2+-transporting ATPase